jgi:MFS family permease
MKTALLAWLLTALYYFYQYALRSAPAVMMPQLSDAFGMTSLAVASMVGLFYYGYSPFSLIAGTAMDRFGPRRVVPIGAAAVGIGSLMFVTGISEVASIGRFLQGAGGVFALVGAVYIASTNFPASRAATLIGATQMFGMAGGSAGQLLVGPVIARGTPWSAFWTGMGALGLAISAVLYILLPTTDKPPAADASNDRNWVRGALLALATVFKNPQSILCGVIAGLLFIPTTIFDMIWGVRFLQEGRGLDYGAAVMRSSTVPIGWIIGCPLLGYLSDKIGRRKPVIIGSACVVLACLAWILYGPIDTLPPYVVGLIAGIASGSAMLPYTIIKEVNPPEYSGTATGVVNFLNFTFSALMGPVFAWVLMTASQGASTMTLEHYQTSFEPLMYGVVLAIGLTFLLTETGWAVRDDSRIRNGKVRAAVSQVSKP